MSIYAKSNKNQNITLVNNFIWNVNPEDISTNPNDLGLYLQNILTSFWFSHKVAGGAFAERDYEK